MGRGRGSIDSRDGRRGRGGLRGRALTLAALLGAACAPPPAAPPGPVPLALIPRHDDQVCLDAGRAGPIRLDEIFETEGISQALASIGPRPMPSSPPWPVHELMVRYEADGRPTGAITWHATVDPETSDRVEAELRGRLKRVPGFLGPQLFRTRLTYGRRVALRLVGEVECLPHLGHAGGDRIVGIPDGVTTWVGGRFVEDDSPDAAVLRLRLAADGSILAVKPLKGAPAAVARAREIVSGLVYEPAIRNGVPVAGELVQAFRFRDLRATPPASPRRDPPAWPPTPGPA